MITMHEPSSNQTSHSLLYRALVNGSRLTPQDRKRLYLIIVIGFTLFIWTSIGLFLSLQPARYLSEWTLILPGVGKGHSVSLDSIGQASATATSPFGSSALDPKVNYKHLALSQPVLTRAAQQLELSLQDFGKPRIKLIDQTSLMEFEVAGNTAQEAYDKAQALYQSLQTQLDILRDRESEMIVQSSLDALGEFSRKLEDSQKNKLDYQINAGVLSLEHFNLLVQQLEEKRLEHEALEARLSFISKRMDALLHGAHLQQQEVTKALLLRNDPVFEEQLHRHADIHTQMSSLNGVWGPDHPQYRHLRVAHDTVDAKLTARGRKLIQDPKASTAELIEWGGNRLDSAVLNDLVTLIADQAGLQEQLRVTALAIERLAQRIDDNADDAVHLEDLARKQQVATAVFTTALAKQDIGKSDRFASYPLLQMLAHPTLPERPDGRKRLHALAGGVVSTLALWIGMTLLWLRKPFLQKALKNG